MKTQIRIYTCLSKIIRLHMNVLVILGKAFSIVENQKSAETTATGVTTNILCNG
jgi:hypothetical protein